MEINYSLDRLYEDKAARSHIISELSNFKNKYKILNKNVLELGCGLGQNLEIFKNDNTVLGVEGLEDVAEKTRSYGIPVNVYNLEFPLTEIEPQSYDVILCLDVLEHLINPYELTKEIHRILKDDGIAIINVPNHFDWRGRIKILFGSDIDTKNFFPNSEEWNIEHIRFFTYKGFSKMLSNADFKIKENLSSRFSTLPFFNKYLKKNHITRNIAQKISSSSSSLWCGGYFVILEKNTSIF